MASTSRARALDLPRAIAISAAGAGRLDGPVKYSALGRVLHPVLVLSVLLNASVATLGAGIAGELYASKSAVFVLGQRGPGRPLRSRLAMPIVGLLFAALVILACIAVGLAAGVVAGDVVVGLLAGAEASGWMVRIVIVWTVLGAAVQLLRTEVYRQGYRDGVPKSYWFLSSAASLRQGGGGFAFALAEVQKVVPPSATIVTVARTDVLRKIYQRHGFRRVRAGKLVVQRP